MKTVGKLKVLRKLSEYEMAVELWVMREGENENKWDYRNMEECYETFLGTPILCAFPNGKVGDGHNMEEKDDPVTGAKYYSFVDGSCERIVGMISDDPKDLKIIQENGEKWLIAKGRLFTFYAKELVDNIISNGVMEVSAETQVFDSHIEGDVEVFTRWSGIGVTILGKGVAPAIPGARIEELAAMKEEFNTVCLKAASYKGNSEDGGDCQNTEEEEDSGKCSECKPDECKPDECGDDKSHCNEDEPDDIDEEDDDVIDESDEIPDETDDKPHNSKNKGVKKNMPISKKQLAELAGKFKGYAVLSAIQAAASVLVCLMSDAGETYTYEMGSLNDMVDPGKIMKQNAQVSFSFNGTDVQVDAFDLTDKMSANLSHAESEIERLTKDLEVANNTINTMRETENKRRLKAAKEIATSTLEAFNENRVEKVDATVLESIQKDVENGHYTESVDADGNWVGDKEVENRVLAKCAASVMEMDKANALKNNSQYIWDSVNGKQTEDDGTLSGLLASLNI